MEFTFAPLKYIEKHAALGSLGMIHKCGNNQTSILQDTIMSHVDGDATDGFATVTWTSSRVGGYYHGHVQPGP